MKLRIKGDSIRIRLTQSEVSALSRDGVVEQQTRFPGSAFVTRVRLAEVADMTASFIGGAIELSIPVTTGRSWAASDEITLEAQEPLHLLLEKDFACLHRRNETGGDDDDTFPRPAT